jgi:hypothetical protein
VSRPTIRSQESRDFHAFVALGDTGKATWLASLAGYEEVANDAATFVRDLTTGELYLSRTDHENDTATVSHIDVASGTAGAPWIVRGQTSYASLFISDGALVTRRATPVGDMDGYRVDGYVAGSGAAIFTSGPTVHTPSFSVIPGYVAVSRLTEDDRKGTVQIWSVPDGKASSVESGLVDVDIHDDCEWNGEVTYVCTGEDAKGRQAIRALDVSTHEVVWQWAEGDPDPETGVSREVPRIIGGYAGTMYAENGEGATYAIDTATGRDLDIEPQITNVDDPYGVASVGYRTLELTEPLDSSSS